MKEYLIECIDRTFDDEDYYKINKYIESLETKIDEAINELSAIMSKYLFEKGFCIGDADLDKVLIILEKGEDN